MHNRYSPLDNDRRSTFRSEISAQFEENQKALPITLHAVGLTYSIKQITILKNITARFSPCEMVALMGPSGAGKTTLLNCLAGLAGGETLGELLVNNEPIPDDFNLLMNFIPQEDILLPSLTVKQTLTYGALLRLPQHLSTSKKNERVNDVMHQLSLEECQDVRIGDVNERGISGGQRKRVSIGLELLTNPSVLFVDEPTSGLDSKTAEDVVDILSNLARAGRTVICTIHQPSWSIFQTFDRIMLLSKGNLMFYDRTERISDFFRGMNFVVPEFENPADYYMRILQESSKRDTILQHWESTLSIERKSSRGSNSIIPLPPREFFTSKWYQTIILIRRNVYDTVHDKTRLLQNIILKLIIGVICGVVFINQGRPTNNTSIFPISGSFLLLLNNSIMDTIFATVISFPLQRSVLLREYRNGSYSLASFFIAYISVSLLFQFIFTLALGLPVYFLVGLKFSVPIFAMFLGTLMLVACIGAALGLFFGIISKDVPSAQQKVIPTIIPLLLFCGYVIPYDSIPIYFRWMYYISFFQYSLGILTINQWKGFVFPDCPERTAQCFHTGNQYLSSINYTPDDVPNFYYILLGYLAISLLAAYALLAYKIQRTKI